MYDCVIVFVFVLLIELVEPSISLITRAYIMQEGRAFKFPICIMQFGTFRMFDHSGLGLQVIIQTFPTHFLMLTRD